MLVCQKFNIKTTNKKLYEIAFTHRSFLVDQKNLSSYEKLEWLGDAVLQLFTSKYIYQKASKLTEGEMTLLRKKAVEGATLTSFSKKLGLQEFIKIGKSIKTINDQMYADIFEAFIGALYVDKKFQIINVILQKTIYLIIAKNLAQPKLLKNAKTKLQEIVKKLSNQSIIYQTRKVANKNNFISKIKIKNKVFAQGQGQSKQLAEVMAAQLALKKLTSEI